jgi:chitinase
MRDLYAAAKPKGLIVSSAMRAVANAEDHYELSEIHKYVDFLNLMTYDYNGGAWSKMLSHNAPLLDCNARWCGKPYDIDTAVSAYLDAGVPASKLVLGLAAYGRSFIMGDTSVSGTPEAWSQSGAGRSLMQKHLCEIYDWVHSVRDCMMQEGLPCH